MICGLLYSETQLQVGENLNSIDAGSTLNQPQVAVSCELMGQGYGSVALIEQIRFVTLTLTFGALPIPDD